MTERLLRIVPTDAPPTEAARLVDDFTPALIDVGAHNLCPGCGEPIAMRSVMEVVAEQGLMQQAIAVFGIGCYTAFSNNLDAEVLQALHGRAPSLATGVKRARPDTVVITIQAREAIDRVVEQVRALRPDVKIISRARDAEHARHLYAIGATDAVPETVEASLQLSEASLVALGVPMGPVIASIHQKRDDFRAELQKASVEAGRGDSHAIRSKSSQQEQES